MPLLRPAVSQLLDGLENQSSVGFKGGQSVLQGHAQSSEIIQSLVTSSA